MCIMDQLQVLQSNNINKPIDSKKKPIQLNSIFDGLVKEKIKVKKVKKGKK